MWSNGFTPETWPSRASVQVAWPLFKLQAGTSRLGWTLTGLFLFFFVLLLSFFSSVLFFGFLFSSLVFCSLLWFSVLFCCLLFSSVLFLVGPTFFPSFLPYMNVSSSSFHLLSLYLLHICLTSPGFHSLPSIAISFCYSSPRP